MIHITKKTTLSAFLFVLLFPFLMVQTSCHNKETDDPTDGTKNMNDLIVSSSFDWSTTIESNFNITTLSNIGTPISGVKVGIFTANPLEEGKLIVSGVTDSNGKYSVNYEIPAYYDSIFVQTDFVGILSPGMVELSNGSFDVVLGGIHQPTATKSTLNVNNT